MNKRCRNYYPSLAIKDISKFRGMDTVIEAEYTYKEQKVATLINFKDEYLIIGGRRIELSSTPCHYGDSRLWFICPLCGQRKGILHFKDGWGCVKCHDLVYSSQQDTKTDFWTWYNKAIAIARQIDKEFWVDGFTFMRESRYLFPNKPKHMKWSKYDQLKAKFDDYVMKGNMINYRKLKKYL